MLLSLNFKITLVALVTSISVINFADAAQMDCTVSEPPNKFHDVIIKKERARFSVIYSYPEMLQDKWYGPFRGVYRFENSNRIYSFEDGTVITLNQQLGLGRSSGWVILGRDGRKAGIKCNNLY